MTGDWLPWIVAAVAIVIALAALRWELYVYEGVHLGPRVQGWLYDQWAKRYDTDKRDLQARDPDHLAAPLLDALNAAAPAGSLPEPLVLDVATGTARLPLTLLGASSFTGHVVGLDLSHGMLASAAVKLAAHGDRVTLVCHSATPLPLAEMARVLRPGGLLLVSRGGPGLGWRGRIHSREEFLDLVRAAGFGEERIQDWQKGDYEFDQVWARKPGQLAPRSHARDVTALLACPACGAPLLRAEPHRLRCRQCQAAATIDARGILMLADIKATRARAS